MCSLVFTSVRLKQKKSFEINWKTLSSGLFMTARGLMLNSDIKGPHSELTTIVII